MDKMTSPSKKERYDPLEQRGRRAEMLICLLNGTETISSIAEKLGFDKDNKPSYISRYIKKLDEKGCIDTHEKRYEDSLKRKYGNRTIYGLNVNYFFLYAGKYGIEFNNAEKKWLESQFESFSRRSLVNDAFYSYNGIIFYELLSTFASRLNLHEIPQKNISIAKKIMELLLKCPLSLELNQSIEELVKRLYEYYGKDTTKIDEFFEKIELDKNLTAMRIKNKKSPYRQLLISLMEETGGFEKPGWW